MLNSVFGSNFGVLLEPNWCHITLHTEIPVTSIHIVLNQRYVGFLWFSHVSEALHQLFLYFQPLIETRCQSAEAEIEQNVHQKALILPTLALIWAPVWSPVFVSALIQQHRRLRMKNRHTKAHISKTTSHIRVRFCDTAELSAKVIWQFYKRWDKNVASGCDWWIGGKLTDILRFL